jgi:hypothetical protein
MLKKHKTQPQQNMQLALKPKNRIKQPISANYYAENVWAANIYLWELINHRIINPS